MTDVTPLGVDTTAHRGVAYTRLAHLTDRAATPGGSAPDHTREVPATVDRPAARAGTDEACLPHVRTCPDDVPDFDDLDVAWDGWVPTEHAPARSAGQGLIAKSGMTVELIVAAAA